MILERDNSMVTEESSSPKHDIDTPISLNKSALTISLNKSDVYKSVKRGARAHTRVLCLHGRIKNQ